MLLLQSLYGYLLNLFGSINSLIESDWEYISGDGGEVVGAIYKNDPTHFRSWMEYTKGGEMVAHIRARSPDENYSYIDHSKTSIDELRSLGYID